MEGVVASIKKKFRGQPDSCRLCRKDTLQTLDEIGSTRSGLTDHDNVLRRKYCGDVEAPEVP